LVFLWARRVLGGFGAIVATLLFASTPTVLAHAGLATTDIGLVAGLGTLFYASLRFAEQPSWTRGAALGLAGAFALVAKFSSLAFFPAAVVASVVLALIG
jgi:4-amino-4-deoxy-L-arabinose transferase-like glycosyltransferase